MFSTLSGIVMGWISQLIFIGYALIESIVGFYAFNYLAPKLPQYGYELPFDHINFWHLFALTVLVHILGVWIQRLTPSLVKINNSSE